MCENMAVELSVGNRGTNAWRVCHGAGQKMRSQPARTLLLGVPGIAPSAAIGNL